MINDKKFMQTAIDKAKLAKKRGDYAIGALIVSKSDVILGVGVNSVKTAEDPTAHAEMLAIRQACNDEQSRYLMGCTLYTTCAPCPMCMTASVYAKVECVVYGATQADMRKYAMTNANYNFKWRAVDVEPWDLYTKYLAVVHPGLRFRQTLREECVGLFHKD